MILVAIDRLLIGYDRHYRWRLALILLLSALQTSLVVLRPMPVKFLVDPQGASWSRDLLTSLDGTSQALLFFVLMAAGLEIVIFALRVTQENRSTGLSERFIRLIRGDIAANLLRGPYRSVAALGLGRVIAAASGDVVVVQNLIKDVVVGATLAAFQLVLMLAVIATLHPPLFFVLLAEIAVLSLLIWLYANWRKAAFLAQMSNQEHFLSWLGALQSRTLDIRFGEVRSTFFGRTLDLIRRQYQTGTTLWRRQSLYFAGVELFIGLASAACLALLFLESGGQASSLGTMLVFLYYAMLIFPCLSRLGEAAPLLTDARNAHNRLSTTLAVHRDKLARESVPAFGAIELRGVGLKAESGDWILKDVDLTIQPGEQVAFLGESGSGKSTLLGMILGLVQPTEGEVRIGGVPLAEMTLADRKRFFFFQRSSAAFFAGTVAENMDPGLTTPTADWPTMMADCRLADRLRVAPEGLRTLMSERGEPFSQGEGQRVAIARAMTTRAPCIVLDEALNSLDATGESSVTSALHRRLSGRTLLAISHRRDVAESFKRVIEVAAGRVVADRTGNGA